MSAIRYLSICSGIEAASVAARGLNWRAVGFAEIDRAASKVLAHHFPGVPNFGDFTTIDAAALGPVDLLIGGTPCFVAGTLILAKRGLIPIEDVRQDDDVWTHQNRWRRVVATMVRQGPTVIVKGQGHSGIETTAEHPFWSRSVERIWNVGSKKSGATARTKTLGSPEWTDAARMNGRFWSSPTGVSGLGIPSFVSRSHEGRNLPRAFDAAFMWFVGAWLGDGWLRTSQRSGRPEGQTGGYVLLCGNKKHERDIADRLDAAGLKYSVSQERTTVRFQIVSKPLARWLDENFGRGAGGKRIPTWLLGAPPEIRQAFFDGYLFADESVRRQSWGAALVARITTINRALAIGVRLLAASLGKSATIVLNSPTRSLTIEGRAVSEQPFYQVSIYATARSSFEDESMRWGKVRSVKATGQTKTVYNFEVEEDNSYVADGLIVHNCQGFSVAGLRGSLSDARSNLALSYVRLAHELVRKNGLRGCLWENVPGVLSTADNAFGCFLGALVGGNDALQPPRGERWPDAGMVSGPRARAAWRILDAQHFGLAQRRRRVFVVAGFGDGLDPAQILFEPKILRGNPAKSRKARQEFAGALAASARGCDENDAAAGRLIAFGGNNQGGPIDVATALNAHGGPCGRQDFESETFVVAHTLRGEGFDASEDGTGRGTPIVPVALDCKAWGNTGFAVAFDLRGREGGAQFEGPHDTANIRAASGGSSRSYVAQEWAVRRLTPKEAERLQGFPDGWTAIGGAADGPRYRQIGNSMAVNVMAWIEKRIDAALRAPAAKETA